MQTSFDFPFQDHYLDEEFLTSSHNIKAFKLIYNYLENQKNSPKIFAIYGAKCSGKTHLAQIWKRRTGAQFIKIDSVDENEADYLIEPNQFYIIEDADQISNQLRLFHIFNDVSNKNAHLLITSNIDLKQIKYQFSDIESRLNNVFSLEIATPDIEFIEMFLTKQFALKQLAVEEKVVGYLAKNLDRDCQKIIEFIRLLELYCFEQKRKITIPLIGDLAKKHRFEI